MILHNLCIDARCNDHAPAHKRNTRKAPAVQEAAAADAAYVNQVQSTYNIDMAGQIERESKSDHVRSHKSSITHSAKRDELCAAVRRANYKRPTHSSFSYSN